MNTWYIFRASWPILDSSRPEAMLRAEAAEQVDAIAAELGAALVEPVRWSTRDGHLFAESDVRPLRVPKPGQVPAGYVKRRERVIRVLAERGNTDRRIADILGCSESAVAKARGTANPPIPPGRGNPTLAGYTPEQLAREAA